jgi:hypothetical protein
MKRNYLQIFGLFLFSLLAFIGCHKETTESPELIEESSTQKRDAKSEKKDNCRVTLFDYYDGIADVHQYDTYSYKSGRVDEWAVWYGGVFKMEYDHRGKLKKSRNYVDDALVYTIHFFYKHDKVVKEIWYVGDTRQVDDEIHYTFDRKGQIIKMESILNGYYTDNTYAANGDLTSWKFYLGGSPLVSGHYTYYNRYKSPFVDGTPGIEYNFPYINSTFGYSKWWYSSEKMVYYDENGNESVYYDQDPKQTKWKIGANKYPELVSYFSPTSSSNHSVGFGYENCERGNNGHHGHNKSSEMARKNTAASTATMSGSIRFVLAGPKNKVKERANEFRMKMKKRSKS